MELQAFFKMSYGLYVVSGAADGRQSGCIVNTVTQITAEPPRVCVAIHKENFTTGLISKSGYFNAVPLTEDASMDLIGRFGFRSGREEDKFAAFPHAVDMNGIPYPTESVAALFSFKVLEQVDVGTHILFVGLATQAQTLSEAPVMTYAYYHQVKRGKTPPKASSYQAQSAPETATGWRCKICGYVHEGAELSPDYICPVCKKGAEFFERM